MKNILLLTLAITANYLTSHFSIANNSQAQPAKLFHSNKVNNNSNKNTFVKATKRNENTFSSITSTEFKKQLLKIKKKDAILLFYLEQEHSPAYSLK